MAHKFRGEIEIESGFGLPRLTTTTRLAYQPPSDGYIVFDTQLKTTAIWDATASEWILGTVATDNDLKIDVLDGVAKNTSTVPECQ